MLKKSIEKPIKNHLNQTVWALEVKRHKLGWGSMTASNATHSLRVVQCIIGSSYLPLSVRNCRAIITINYAYLNQLTEKKWARVSTGPAHLSHREKEPFSSGFPIGFSGKTGYSTKVEKNCNWRKYWIFKKIAHKKNVSKFLKGSI